MMSKITNQTIYVLGTFWGNATYNKQVLMAQKKRIRAMCNIKQKISCKPKFLNKKIQTHE